MEYNQIDFSNEDLSIYVKLEVLKAKRFYEDGESFQTLYEQKHSINHDGNILCSDYENISGNKNFVGITSLKIAYNSWYVPEVDITIVDIRGNSIFHPIDQGEDSFIGDLFVFPYPKFRLTVKGHYGKTVEYELFVRDVRSNFNDSIGNFEVKVKFIGNSFGILTDIPMDLILIAPYIDYNGYVPLGDFKGTNTPIPSLLTMFNKTLTKIDDETTDSTQESDLWKNEKANLQKIINLCRQINTSLKWGALEKDDNNGRFKFTKSFCLTKNDLEILNSLNRNNVRVLLPLAKIHQDGFIEKMNNVSLREGPTSLLLSLDWNDNNNEVDENSLDETYPGMGYRKEIENILNQLKEQYLIDKIKECFKKYDDEFERLRKILADKTETYHYKEITPSYHEVVNIMTIVKIQEDEIEKEEYQFDFSVDIEKIEKIINDYIKENSLSEGDKNKIFSETFNDEMGFIPTIGKFYEIVLSHFNCLHKTVAKFLDKQKKDNRRITNYNCDVPNKFKKYPPFPMFYDENKEEQWIGSSGVNLEEINFIKSIVDAYDKMEREYQNIENYLNIRNTFGVYPRNGLPSMWSDVIVNSLNVDFNVYNSPNKDANIWGDISKSPIIKRYALKSFLFAAFNTINRQDENDTKELFLIIEALNAFHAIKDNKQIMEKIQSWNFAENSVTLESIFDSQINGYENRDFIPYNFNEYILDTPIKKQPQVREKKRGCEPGKRFEGRGLEWVSKEKTPYLHFATTIEDYIEDWCSYLQSIKTDTGIIEAYKSLWTPFQGGCMYYYYQRGNMDYAAGFYVEDSYGNKKYFRKFGENVKPIDAMNTILEMLEDKDTYPKIYCENNTWYTWPDNSGNTNYDYNILCFLKDLGFSYEGMEDRIITNLAEDGGWRVFSNLELFTLGYLVEKHTDVDEWFAYLNRRYKDFENGLGGAYKYIQDFVKKNENGVHTTTHDMSFARDYLIDLFKKRTYFYSPVTLHKMRIIKGASLVKVSDGEETYNMVTKFLGYLQGYIEMAIGPKKEIKQVRTDDVRFLSIYKIFKNLWDRYNFGARKIDINFFAYNHLYEDISEDRYLTYNTFFKTKEDIRRGNKSFFSFIYDIANELYLQTFALPMNLFNKDYTKIFEKKPYMSVHDKEYSNNIYFFDISSTSKHLKSNEYTMDGIDLENKNYIQSGAFKKINYFDVSMGLPHQHMFYNISIGTDKPRVTAESIASELLLSEMGSDDTQTSSSTSYNLFDINENRSFECKFETLSNMSLCPLMYFQLKNVPMFNGGYMITKVEHTLNGGSFRTKILGVKMSNKKLNTKINLNYVKEGTFWEYEEMDTRWGTGPKYISLGRPLKEYSREKTTIIIDMGHTAVKGGKQSPYFNLHEMRDETHKPEFGENNNDIGVLNSKYEDDSGQLVSVFDSTKNIRDDGYGGVTRYREYWGNRKLGLELKDQLKNAGCKVVLIGDPKITAKKGPTYTDIHKYENSIVISLHSNAHNQKDIDPKTGWGKSGGDYFKIFYQDKMYVTDDKKYYYPENPHDSQLLSAYILDVITNSNNNIKEKIGLPGTTLRYQPSEGYGQSKTGVFPLTHSKRPAVLIEGFFHTTNDHVKMLSTKKYRQAIAKAYTQGILAFLDAGNKEING